MYNYQQWLADTAVKFKPRSALLQALDKKVQALSPVNPPLPQIKATLVAFNAWADRKRQQAMPNVAPGLEPSAKERDSRGAFSKLLAQLYLAYLIADPDEFLTSYTMLESGMDESRTFTFYAYSEASNQTAGVISDIAARKRFRITNVPVPGNLGQETVQSFNVRMVKRTEPFTIGDIESAYLPLGPEFMTTGMLSGCCFVVYTERGSNPYVAHIQPRTGQTGDLLKPDIDNNGHFDARLLDRVKTFGLGDYGTQVGGAWAGYAMVIGVYRMGAWEIYGQDLGRSNIGPPVKVVRIA
jgi:hypothetical protein